MEGVLCGGLRIALLRRHRGGVYLNLLLKPEKSEKLLRITLADVVFMTDTTLCD